MRAKIPFGYRIQNGRAEPDPVEAPQLQLFFHLYIEGKPASVSAREAGIARTAACCRKMLSNPVYCGTDYYPQLISPALMEAAERKRQENLPKSGKKPGRKPHLPVPIQSHFFLSDFPPDLPADSYELFSVLYNCIHNMNKE